MNSNCGCGSGVRQLTPADLDNRPGLNTIAYRAGTHFTFLETMKARLGDHPELLGLSKRVGTDFSIALLDAWSIIADVLTFYQERIANEGYLRTATERVSVLELASLIGYELRPGVAASVYLAYTIDTDRSKPKPAPTFTDIPAGSRSQSIPGPGELPQSFETSALLKASDTWNNLRVRKTKPHQLKKDDNELYFKGITTNLKPGDRLLFDFGDKHTEDRVVRRILAVDPDNDNDRTKVTLSLKPNVATMLDNKSLLQATNELLKPLTTPPATHPVSSMQLPRDMNSAFSDSSDLVPRLITAFHPEITPQQLYTALENAPAAFSPIADVYVFRTRASPFGANAHAKQVFGENNQIMDSVEWPLTTAVPSGVEKFTATIFVRKVDGIDGDVSSWTVITQISLAAGKLIEDRAKGKQLGDTFQIDFPQANDNTKEKEFIKVALTELTDSNPPFRLEYKFHTRSLEFSVGAPKVNQLGGAAVEISTKGTDPSSSVMLDKGRVGPGGLVADFTFHIEGTFNAATATNPTEFENIISLDNIYDKLVPGGWILLEGAIKDPLVSRIQIVRERSRSNYGISGKVTEVMLDQQWLDTKSDLSAVRKVAVFAQSEKLELAEDPIETPIKDGGIELDNGVGIELDGIYPGLESGRWLIVSGKRNDGVEVTASELVMLAGSELKPNAAGDSRHTFLRLADKGLAYTYDPSSVTIFGNVVQATHGETRVEVLGSGDASRPLQEFQLKQFPLTYVSAITPSGIENTLNVRVNDILWHEAAGLSSLGPNDRSFLTLTGDDSKTKVVFGNGVRGARLPTGVENVKAVYRTGIGLAGNVKAEQISILSTKPLGVKEVINPIRASGGADRESREQARRNAPLAVMSLDRLVSVQDYADFARTFGGVGKAVATQIGGRVRIIIAGADATPIDEASSLFKNLGAAFRRFADPQQLIELAVYEPLLLLIQARVAILPDFQFETVAPKIRTALLGEFAFDNRDLGQDVLRSEIVATIQNVEGVQYVALDTVQLISKDLASLFGDGEQPSEPVKPLPRSVPPLRILPGQLAYLTNDISETLILTELVNA